MILESFSQQLLASPEPRLNLMGLKLENVVYTDINQRPTKFQVDQLIWREIMARKNSEDFVKLSAFKFARFTSAGP